MLYSVIYFIIQTCNPFVESKYLPIFLVSIDEHFYVLLQKQKQIFSNYKLKILLKNGSREKLEPFLLNVF